MEIRFAEAKDVTGILALLKQVGQVHHEGRPDIFRKGAQKYGASQVLAMLNSTKTPIFVAVEDEKVLGYGFCQVKTYENDPVMTDRTEVYIDDLCVDENCRKQGVGKKIYEEIKLDLLILSAVDVLTFSQENEKDDGTGDIFSPLG